MSQQTSLIDEIIDRIGVPPHVIAHSFGGLAAIVHALTGRNSPASLLLIEANPLGLLRAVGDHEHYTMFTSMTDRYFAEFEQRNPEAARLVIDFYGGQDTFDRMPSKARSYIMSTTAVNIRDWTSGTLFEPEPGTLLAISAPTIVVRGDSSHPAMQKIAELLHKYIPGAQLVTMKGGSHFLPITHPKEIAVLIRQQVGQTLH